MSEEYSDWWIEFNHGLKRAIPPTRCSSFGKNDGG